MLIKGVGLKRCFSSYLGLDTSKTGYRYLAVTDAYILHSKFLRNIVPEHNCKY